eukprot:5053995-Lingulodinium_polyedra.AAC.1
MPQATLAAGGDLQRSETARWQPRLGLRRPVLLLEGPRVQEARSPSAVTPVAPGALRWEPILVHGGGGQSSGPSGS